MSPPATQKSLRVRILEWFLLLFALSKSGIHYLPYHLYLTRGSLDLNSSWDVSAWIYYLLRNACALGILGYVLFRNSRWCQVRMAHWAGTQKTMWEPQGSETSGPDCGPLRIFELLLVLFVAFSGSVFYSFEILVGYSTIPIEAAVSGLAMDVYRILSYAAALGLLGYVLSRRSRGFQDLGLDWTSRDVAVALPLALSARVADWLLGQVTFPMAELLSGQRPPVPDTGNLVFGSYISITAVLVLILNGVFEELIVRGYLMTEVRRFTGSILSAIFCSVTVQVSYHFYQGGPAALAHAGCFIVLAGYYAKTNRILPPIVAHVAIDLYWLVMYALSHA